MVNAPIEGPLLLLAGLVLAAGGVYVLRRVESVAALLAAAVTAALGLVVLLLPLDKAFPILGRPVLLGATVPFQELSLTVTPATRGLLVFLLGMAALAFLLAWLSYQGRTFYPFGLVMLALWALAAMMEPLSLSPLPLALASILGVFLIQAGKAGDTRGAWRQLLFPTLGVPIFLIAAWYVDQAPLNPDDLAPLKIAGWLLIGGFVLLLQPAPLHVAMPAVARRSPPVVAAFLWLGGQATALFLLQRFLSMYPWLASSVDSSRWLLWLGVFTALVGGAMAASHDNLGHFFGYAAVHDYGILLTAMALRSDIGVPAVAWLMVTRTLALFTLAVGVAVIRHHMETDRLVALRGAVSRLPWAVIALVAGGFALAGMPLTAQFGSRWSLLQLVALIDIRWALLVVLASGGVVLGAVRTGRACFGSLSASPVEREPASLAFLSVLLVLLGVVVGIVPQILASPVAAVVAPLLSNTP
jgi:formate hydrogenlyase subunit 3/multisubunit Na+/H+ antiporter MnhD subunit